MAHAPTDHRRELFRLAWPASLAMVVHSLYRLNDQFFVQGLGVEAQSAVAVGGMLVIWFMAFAQMVSTGTLVIAARRLGEGDKARADAAIRTGLRTGFAVGLTLAVVSVSGLGWLCEILIQGDGVEHERALARDYMFWIGIGQLVMVVLPTIDAAFFAMKDTRTPLMLQVLSILTNGVLNWQMVPIWGVAGAGLASVLSRLLSLVLGLWLLHRNGVAILGGSTSLAIARRILALGFPACIGISVYSLVYQVILVVTFPHFGAGGRSALGVGFGIESVFYCFFWGIGTAVASLVGRSLGEGRPERAEAITKSAARLSLILGAATSIVFWVWGAALVRLFAGSGVAAESNTQYLELMAWAQPFQALQTIYDQALIGAGATVPAMIATSTMNIIRIPLAHTLAVWAGWGLPGIWWAINFSSFGKYLWSRLLFRSGRWKDKVV